MPPCVHISRRIIIPEYETSVLRSCTTVFPALETRWTYNHSRREKEGKRVWGEEFGCEEQVSRGKTSAPRVGKSVKPRGRGGGGKGISPHGRRRFPR